MKRILGIIAFCMFSALCWGQSYFNCSLVNVGDYCPGSSGSPVLNAGIDTQNVYAVVQGTPGSLTLLIQGSIVGDFSDAATCATATIASSSTPTGPSLSCNGVYTKIRVKLSAISGFTGVNVTYVGVSSAAKNPPRVFPGAPTGSCSEFNLAVNTSNGDFYDCFSSAWNKIAGGSGTGITGTLTANQDVYATGTHTVASTPAILFDGSGNLLTVNQGNGTHAGSATINLGYTDGGGLNALDVVNQTTTNDFRGAMQTSSFQGVYDNIFTLGFNVAQGGGPIDNTLPANWCQMESKYCTSDANTCQNEFHCMVYPTNSGVGQLRWLTTANNTKTGVTQFMHFGSDTGAGLYYLTGDGTNVTSVTASWSSAAGGTFTFTKPAAGTWAVDYASGTYVTVTSCTPSAYNSPTGGWTIAASGAGQTTFTITGVGANPGSSATGCIVQGGANYAYFAVGPTAGVQTFGVAPASIGGAIMENGSANATAGLTLITESGSFGGSNNPIVFHAGGTAGITPGSTTCATEGQFEFPGSAAADYFWCDGTHWQYSGSSALAYVGLLHTGSGPLTISSEFVNSGGLAIWTNYTSDTNASGKIFTTNGGGATAYDVTYQVGAGGGTPITAVYNCGWSSVACNLVGGSTVGVAINTSGNVNLASGGGTLSYNGTAGLTGSTLCSATINYKLGGITVCTATSDPRLKNYEPSPYGLNAVMRINPIRFTWNELGRKYNADDSTVHLGFNAANIQQVMPESVGTEQHDGVDYLSLPHGTDGIVAALVNAVKEQQAEIQELRTKIAALESK